eukprot:1192827-Prorocentrum_minimum.AAC.3
MGLLGHLTAVIRSGVGSSQGSLSKRALGGWGGHAWGVNADRFAYVSTVFRDGSPLFGKSPRSTAEFSSTASSSNKHHEPPLTKLDYKMELFSPERIRNFSIIAQHGEGLGFASRVGSVNLPRAKLPIGVSFVHCRWHPAIHGQVASGAGAWARGLQLRGEPVAAGVPGRAAAGGRDAGHPGADGGQLLPGVRAGNHRVSMR